MDIRNLIYFVLNLSSVLLTKSPEIKTSSGTVRGTAISVNGKIVEQYLNIPYAEPPVGRLRFSKPMAISKPLEGIIDGTKEGRVCYQSPASIRVYSMSNPQSEDCLVLNVWTKRSLKTTKDLKPVMFWIYGGSLHGGSIFSPRYNGSLLAMNDVVVVTVNYRLGHFGWLYGEEESAPGNLGLYDQLLALNWVKNNIKHFGGDPNQVTIFGQSAGSWCVSAHIVSPLSKGLFKRAIVESGAYLQNKDTPVLSKSKALSEAKKMAKHFNCSADNQWLDCLRRIDAKILNSYVGVTAYPIYETEILPLNAQKAFQAQAHRTDIDIMVGTVKDEGSVFGRNFYPKSLDLHSTQEFRDLVDTIQGSISLPFPNLNSEKISDFYLRNVYTNSSAELEEAFNSFYGDLRVTCSVYFFAKQFAKYTPKRNVFFYYWTHVSRLIANELGCTPDMGVCHTSEVPYIFGEPVLKNMTDHSFSEYAMELWTDFAKYGNPLKGFPNIQWPRLIDSSNRSNVTNIKEINPLQPNHIIDNLFSQNCDGFWKNYFI